MPSDRMRMLGIGSDEDSEQEREAEYFKLQGRLELKKLNAEMSAEIWNARLDTLREQYDQWATVVMLKWQFGLVTLTASFISLFFVWLIIRLVFGTFGSLGAIIGPWNTGYSIQQGAYHVSMFHILYKDLSRDDGWVKYTPPVSSEDSQVQLEQLQAKYSNMPNRMWKLEATSKKETCWTVIREAKFAHPVGVSPCHRDYGHALATLSAFQQSYETGDPLVVPDVDYLVPAVLPDFELPEPLVIKEIQENTVFIPTDTPPETTVILVPQVDDYWLPYGDTSVDVGPEILEGLTPDHVFYVLEE